MLLFGQQQQRRGKTGRRRELCWPARFNQIKGGAPAGWKATRGEEGMLRAPSEGLPPPPPALSVRLCGRLAVSRRPMETKPPSPMIRPPHPHSHARVARLLAASGLRPVSCCGPPGFEIAVFSSRAANAFPLLPAAGVRFVLALDARECLCKLHAPSLLTLSVDPSLSESGFSYVTYPALPPQALRPVRYSCQQLGRHCSRKSMLLSGCTS